MISYWRFFPFALRDFPISSGREKKLFFIYGLSWLNDFKICGGGSKPELHMGICFLPVCCSHLVRSYILYRGKQTKFLAWSILCDIPNMSYVSCSILLWQLNVNPILSVLLSSFTGFGIAISTNSLLVEYLRWRSSRLLQYSHQQNNRAVQQAQQLQQQQSTQTWHQEHQQPRQQSVEDSNVGSTDSTRQREATIPNS